MITTRRARKARSCDRACDHPIHPGDLVEHAAIPPGGELGNTVWLHSAYHAGRCPIEGPTMQEWNAVHPVGTQVLAWPGARTDEPLRTRTRTPAWELGSGHPVVSVEGYAGGIFLTHVEAVS